MRNCRGVGGVGGGGGGVKSNIPEEMGCFEMGNIPGVVFRSFSYNN